MLHSAEGNNLGAQRAHTVHPVPLQLQTRLGDRGHDPHELRNPAPRRCDQDSKRHALLTFCPPTLVELKDIARRKLKSDQKRTSIITAC
jgi:hypothetical protein